MASFATAENVAGLLLSNGHNYLESNRQNVATNYFAEPQAPAHLPLFGGKDAFAVRPLWQEDDAGALGPLWEGHGAEAVRPLFDNAMIDEHLLDDHLLDELLNSAISSTSTEETGASRDNPETHPPITKRALAAETVIPANLVAETQAPTDEDILSAIVVTLPPGVSKDDVEAVSNLIAGQQNPETYSASEAPSATPTAQPSSRAASTKRTKFRQEFQVGNSREFTQDEVDIMQSLFEAYTADFVPPSRDQVLSKVVTTCTVVKQTYLIHDDDRRLEHGPEPPNTMVRRRNEEDLQELRLNVDYEMEYESFHYDVNDYPKLFQQWVTTNIDLVRDQLQFLNIDVTKVDFPKRIVVSTPSPSTTPSSISTTPSSLPTASPSPYVVDPPKPTVTMLEVLSLCCLAVSAIVLIFCWRRGQSGQSRNADDGTSENYTGGRGDPSTKRDMPVDVEMSPPASYPTGTLSTVGTEMEEMEDIPI